MLIQIIYGVALLMVGYEAGLLTMIAMAHRSNAEQRELIKTADNVTVLPMAEQQSKAEEDILRQLRNILIYDGSAKGQIGREDEDADADT